MSRALAFDDRDLLAPIGTELAEMAFGSPPAVSEALMRAIRESRLGYFGARDRERLAEVTSAWLQDRYDWHVEHEAVRPVGDLVAGFRAVLTHFVGPEEAIIVPTPAYMPFLSVPPTAERKIIQVPMLHDERGWRYDLAGIERAFADGGRLLVLCNPHNPIGKVASEAELADIERIVDAAGGMVFADEIHAPLIIDETARHVVYANRTPRSAGHTITATSASKAFNIPGLKCGQLVFSNPAHLEHWLRIGHWYEHQTSVLGLVGTEAAYQHGGAWLDDVLQYTRGTIQAVESVLGGSPVSCTLPAATYLLWLDVRGLRFAGVDRGPLAHAVREELHLVVTDGTRCGTAGEGFVRFNAALPREQVIEAMERLVSHPAVDR